MNRLSDIVHENIEIFGKLREGVKVDKYVIMPNHVHMIIALEDANISISYLIALLKTSITKQIRRAYPSMQVWQRSFHDHIIRNEEDYQRIWSYIDTNPIRWELDCFYVDNRAD
jgi:REP element-mobilizing transposase RayT